MTLQVIETSAYSPVWAESAACNGMCMVKVAPAPGEAAAMPVEDMFDQRETQSGAALRAAVGDIHPVKSLCQPRKMLG